MEAAQDPMSGPEEVEMGSSGRGRLPVQRPCREPDDFVQRQNMIAAFNLIAGARHVGHDFSLDRFG